MTTITWRSFEDTKKVSQQEVDELINRAVNQSANSRMDPWIQTGDTIIFAHRYTDGSIEIMDCRLRRIGYVEGWKGNEATRQ